MKDIIKFGIGAIIVVFVVGAVGCAAGFIANPFIQASRIVNQTIDADNVIYNYEWFKKQYQTVQGYDAKIRTQTAVLDDLKSSLPENRSEWDSMDKEEVQRLTVVVAGLKNGRTSAVAEYNAKSKMVNRSIFKAGDAELPEEIPLETF